jgi:hypothetical protein
MVFAKKVEMISPVLVRKVFEVRDVRVSNNVLVSELHT